MVHGIKERLCSLQEAVAHATGVDAVIKVKSKKLSWRRGDGRTVGFAANDLAEKVKG